MWYSRTWTRHRRWLPSRPGIGDAVVLWAPHIYTGLGKGWKIAANTKTAGGAQPIVFIAEKEFTEKNPEVMASSCGCACASSTRSEGR